MQYKHDVELAIERHSKRADAAERARLRVTVLFTSAAATPSALARAGELAAKLSADITLLVPQIVPFPLPLESPPVLIDFNERRFQALAEHAGVEASVRIYLCRERESAIHAALAARSLVVMGVRRLWWFSSEMRLARKLQRAGHEVVIAKVEKQ